MLVKSHYARNNEVKDVRVMTVNEAMTLSNHATVINGKNQWATVKVNGAIKTWKRRPLDCRIPYKYGMYEYGYIEYVNGVCVSEIKPVIEVTEKGGE